MRQIDVNADLGEEITDDEGLLQVVSSANLACGFHAGNPVIMRQVCDRAAELGVAVGAQVSYHDREHFGRRRLDVAAPVLAQQVADQVGLLTEIARAAGIEVSYLKPHGALYNRVVDDVEQASAVLAGSGELPVLGLPGGVLLAQAKASNRTVWREGFPDRGYTSDGRLVPRDQPGALITAEPEIVRGALRLAEQVDSLCLHGDSPGAVAHARAVRTALAQGGFVIRPFSTGD